MTAHHPVHIHTFSGIAFDLRDPQPAMLRLEDIIHSLSLMNRYNGAALFPYSVAQHSLLPPELRLEGLLHDAAEAYIGDMVSPLKQGDVGVQGGRGAHQRPGCRGLWPALSRASAGQGGRSGGACG